MGSGSSSFSYARAMQPAIATAVLTALLSFGAGCDGRDATAVTPNGAGASSTSGAASTPTPFAQRMQPLMDELVRLKTIIDREPLDVTAFRGAVGEVEVQLARAEGALLPGDADRSSWRHLTEAIEFIRRADKNIAREDVLSVPPPAPRSATGGPPGLDDLDAMNRHSRQLIAQATELVQVSADTPKALAAASGKILLVQLDLRDGK